MKDALEAQYLEELEALQFDSPDLLNDLYDNAVTADGCRVEPDGTCRHGYSSPLLLLGMI